MCDYSLELYRSRPATEEEQYTLRRFPSGTMGFTAARDCETAVCIPADARLRLEGIGEAVQQAYSVGPIEEVVMTRVEGGAYAHKDAVKFANGRKFCSRASMPASRPKSSPSRPILRASAKCVVGVRQPSWSTPDQAPV